LASKRQLSALRSYGEQPLHQSGEPEQLTNNPTDEFEGDLSPDGRAVAYHSWRAGTRDIEVKPLDGGPIEYVTATPGQESYPRWSPDGRAILFIDQRQPMAVLLTWREDGGRWSAPVRLASTPSAQGAMDWSPDGRLVAHVGGSPEAPVLMVIPSDGGEPRQLLAPSPTAPALEKLVWGPDGRTIYYKRHDSLGRASFWSVSAAGGTPRLLVRFPDPNRQSNRADDLATDGKHLFFAREERQSDVFVVALLYR
jgi:Tol biopolymer transport system component